MIRSLVRSIYFNARRNKFETFVYVSVVITVIVIYQNWRINKQNMPKINDVSSDFQDEEDVDQLNHRLEDKEFSFQLAQILCPRLYFLDPNNFKPYLKCRNFHLCHLNDPISRVRKKEVVTNVRDLTEVVTAVVKSAGRFECLMKLLKSAWQFYPTLKFIVVDDYRNSSQIPKEFTDFIQSSSLISYYQLEDNAGLSKGRNVGVQLVKTEFVLLCDDDFVFTYNTNLELPYNVLTTTDVDLVGGRVDQCTFFGVFKLNETSDGYSSNYSLKVYEYIARSYVEGFPFCYQVDITKNFFMARTESVLKSGGWNDNLKVSEHKDFFLKLSMNKRKVVFCPSFQIRHEPINDFVRERRFHVWQDYRDYFYKTWKLEGSQFCKWDSFNSKSICHDG